MSAGVTLTRSDTEDIPVPEDIQPRATEHTTHRDWCSQRRKRVEPKVPKRLADLIDTPWEDKQAKRLIKRLRRHRCDLFTFLDQEGIPFDNNHAQQSVRPAVVIRKNSYGNRNDQGADCLFTSSQSSRPSTG